MVIDTHAHLTSDLMLPHLSEVLQRAMDAGVEKIVNICTDVKSLQEGIALEKTCPWVYTTAATTPHDVETEGEGFFPVVERAALEQRLVALGETGLDYFYKHSDKRVQQQFLSRYFSLAKKAKLPLVFHCREAFGDLFSMADEQYKALPALLHCFTGSLQEAKEVLDRGWLISLSGILTFKKSENLREVAKYVPLESLVIETDSPYLAPQSQRGKSNEPAFVIEIAKTLASIKGINLDEVARVTTDNAKRFFSFSKQE